MLCDSTGFNNYTANGNMMAKDENNILHKGLVPAMKALELVLEGARPVAEEMLPLAEAADRVLSGNLSALRTQPPFPASAMDGYAVRHDDIAQLPVSLRITGQSAAGHPFRDSIGKGECIRIFTGAPVPDGMDTIVIQENTESDGTTVTILEGAERGNAVRRAGIDFSKGDMLLEAGRVLDPQALSLAAAMNHPTVPVWQKPTVAVMATGDELVLPGGDLSDGQILASNTFGISAIARSAGASVIDLGIARDTLEDLKSRIGAAFEEGAELIVTTGGASVGDHDLVKPAMDTFGFVFSFVKIAIRPGKPVMFARAVIDGKQRRFLGLPGNPVSSLVTAHMFMRPLIRQMAGYPPAMLQPVHAILDCDLPANGKREDYMRATASRDSQGRLHTRPFERQDSSMLSTLSASDCLLIRPVDAPPATAGQTVPVVLIHDV